MNCVASSLLANKKPEFILLEYEPLLPGCSRTIDFRVTANTGEIVYIDVKTIKPEDTDRWDQFQRAKIEGWLPENVIVGVSEKWLGGEIWHAWFAARARMLEYSLEMEQKIADAGLALGNVIRVLALCGDGFRWHLDQLEDYVAFYSTGTYRPDDSLAKVEQKYMVDKKIFLKRTILRFAYFQRRQGEIYPNRLNWNVHPPDNQFC